MDTAVKERLIGAAVLVVVVVVVAPALLTGPRPPAGPVEPSAEDTRVVEIDLARNEGAKDPDDRPVPEAPVSPPEGTQGPAQGADRAAESARVPAAQKVTADPKAAAEPAAAPPASSSGGWAVQVAALSKAEAAERMAAGLRKKGYQAFVLEHRSEGRVLYRVRVGPEAQRERAEALARRLSGEGFKPAVVAQP